MTFEDEFPIEGELILSYVHKSGRVFRIKPLVGIGMNPEQILAELKYARIELNKAVEYWESKNLDDKRVKEAIYKIASEFPKEDNNHVGLFLLKELGLGI